MSQPSPLSKYSFCNLASKRVYQLPGNSLLNTLYKNKRANYADSEFDLIEFAESISGPDLQNYKVAMNSSNANKWKQAYNTEILTSIANKIQKLVELPLEAQVVNSGQVFKL